MKCTPFLFAAAAGVAIVSAVASDNKPEPVVFDWFEYSGSDEWFEVPASKDTIRNPVLAGFHPDPSICRVGEDYYLVNSSFSWFPGVPIFRSRDLKNWTQIGHVLDRPSQLPLEGLGVSRGVFAPTIRHHKGVFYMITTLVDAGGNFYVTATDPAGPWSDPVWLPEIDGIDPSLFFDRDGRAFVVNNGAPDYEPLYDGHRAIWMQELDYKAGKLVGPRKVIVDRGVDPSKKPIWIEGPHLLRVDDWYYLICAEGGTAEDHSEVVFRSRDVWGPYEPGPVNPILTQRDLDPGREFPVTCTGHADFVETRFGEWWAVFLGCRPYEDNLYNTGRETFMHSVFWTNGWPMILAAGSPVPPVLVAPDLLYEAPAPNPHNGNFLWRDEFQDRKLMPMWNTLRAPGDGWMDLSIHPGSLVITPQTDRLTGFGKPAFVGRRQQHATFSASTIVMLSADEGVSAGMAAFQNENHHFYFGVRKTGEAWTVFLERSAGGEPEVVAEQSVSDSANDQIYLRIEGRGRPYSFSFGTDGAKWTQLGNDQDGSILSTAKAGGFVGTYIGLHSRLE